MPITYIECGKAKTKSFEEPWNPKIIIEFIGSMRMEEHEVYHLIVLLTTGCLKTTKKRIYFVFQVSKLT